jgi:hypothetical protein
VIEIAPGIWHWTAFHDRIGTDVSSYYLSDEGVLIDPLLPPEGDPLGWLRDHGPPSAIVLTNRHHYRDSGRLVREFSLPVLASRPGMHEFSSEQPVEPFDFGDRLPGGLVAHEVGAICADETAVEIPGARAIALADGLVRFEALDGPLGFVPDWLLGDDPDAVKHGLRRSLARLLELDFDHLLLAHGMPLIDDGREQLEAFVARG